MCLRAISSSSKSVTVVPSSTLPNRFTTPASSEYRGGELCLAGSGVADDSDISYGSRVINFHTQDPPGLVGRAVASGIAESYGRPGWAASS